MSLFRRNKIKAAVPAEVQEYYQSEKRDKAWLAWLLAIGTLFATILVVLGLFFGGRWAYRKLANSPKKPTVGVQKAPTSDPASKPSNTTSTAPPTTTNQPASGSVTPNAQNTAPATTPTTTSPSSSNLPSTGPGDIVAVFFITSVMGYVLHYQRIFTRNR